MARPEKILNRTSFGTAAVTIASTKAIEITAPVFCSIVRAPGGDPAAVGRDGAHHRGGVGRVEHARADPDQAEPERALPVGAVGPRVVIAGERRRR